MTIPSLPDQRTREEWSVESIGGGITGSRELVQRWLEEWRNEYGDRYSIHLHRRVVTETPWESVDVAAFDEEHQR